MIEKGLLGFETPLESVVPGLPHDSEITVKHLLDHSSGIPSDVYLQDFGEKSRQALTLDEAVGWVRNEGDARVEPGDRFDYSNSGFLPLSSMIEKVTGVPYKDYLAEGVFAPPPGWKRAAWILKERPCRGGQRDTPERIGGRETPWGNRYALGWFMDELDGSEMAVALGSTGGFAATLRHFTNEDLVVVVLLNHDFLLYEALFDQISLIALGKPWVPLLQMGPSEGPEHFSEVAGVYRMDDGTLLQLRRHGNRMEFGESGTASFFEVFPMGKNRGYVAAQNSRLIFRPGGLVRWSFLPFSGTTPGRAYE